MNYQVLPELSSDEYAALKASIAEIGVQVPVVYDVEGRIIDGHHRVRACEELRADGKEIDWPKEIRKFDSEEQRRGYARLLNLQRRHLNQEAKRLVIREQLLETPGISDRQIAQMLGVSQPTVGTVRKEMEESNEVITFITSTGKDGKEYPRQRAPKVSIEDPEAEDALLTSAKAIREQRREVKTADVALSNVIELPSGVYHTIVVDPPWPMQMFDRDVRPNQVGLDYPTMSIEDIARLNIPAADNAQLFLWTTQKFLPDAIRLLDAWRFSYLLTMVWHKPGGPQPFKLPQYNCEFVVVGRRGSTDFVDTKQFCTCFEAPRREHSRKPAEFYALLQRVCRGPRLDMFSREKHEGFDQYGNELDRFSPAA